jgi:ribonuclease T2
MNRMTASTLLFSLALIASGCKTVPQPKATQKGSDSSQSANQDKYNRTYETESHHRQHRGRRNEGSNDNWTSYDRAEMADEPSGGRNAGAYPPRQRGSRSQNTDTATARRSRRHHNIRAVTAAPGQFDFYVLNLSWSPEFCNSHPRAAECAQRRAFTLHGLWPQNNDGTYPEDCSETPGLTNPSQFADIYPDPALLQHEWQTHGTCTALAPDQFFVLARRAEQFVNVPAELSHLTQQTTLTPTQIITLFAQSNPAIPASSFAISCGNNNLTAFEVCLDKDLKPASCSAVKTCRANQIRISAP